jgi:hypothetical protein
MASQSQEQFEALLPFYLNGTLTLEQRSFVKQFWSANQAAIRSMDLSQEMYYEVQSWAPSKEQENAKAHNFLDRWAAEMNPTCEQAPALHTPPGWGFPIRNLVGSIALAATVAVFAIIPEPSSMCLFQDGLDGRADVTLVLAKGKSHEDSDILEHLAKANAVIVGKYFDGTHQHIDVDLDGRCLNQDNLIHGMKAAGQLNAHALLGNK